MAQSNTGGPVAIRGYLVQTLVALLDIALAEPPFAEITLEPDHADEQFDFVWNNAAGKFAVQVKSTVNEFQKSAVEGWATKLQAARTNEDCRLILVGNYHTSLAAVDSIGAVKIEKKNLDLSGLLEQAAHRLARFAEAQGLDAGTAAERETIVHSLVSRLLNHSTTREPLGRDAFVRLLSGWIREAPRQELAVDLSHFDVARYAPEHLVGRGDEMRLLDEAWNQAIAGAANRPRVLTFVAMGGEGKTSLVAKWAAQLSGRDWPGCEAVFAWSFYSQGTSEAASSDLFLKEALVFFGDAEMANSARHVVEKGKRLAQLVGAKRSLLILDGVEPLQYAPTAPLPGELKDYGLSALLKGLAANGKGLCVVTTRYLIPDLKAYRQSTAPEIELKRLSPEAGVELLQSLGVRGTQAEYERLVEDVKGHALTLNLLGTYLRDAHGGDIRRRDQMKLEEADAEEQGGHAFRVMDAYVQWFEADSGNAEENRKAQRALAILRLMGLFDRPAPADCFHALLKAPAIPHLTELLVEKNEAKRNMALARLETAKLLTVNRAASGVLVSLDAHPLLREYFAKQLREQYPASWREAHRRIYKQLITTKEGEAPTLEQLLPLYQAVVHGCLAGMQQEACDKVYRDRIKRGEQHYNMRKLGSFGSDLGAIASFFDKLWQCVSPVLTEVAQAWLLNEAAIALRALGRLNEAIEPMRAGLESQAKQSAWKQASQVASNLSELELMLGDLVVAVNDAELSVSYADQSGNAFERQTVRAILADALHQAGRAKEAETYFREAEAIQAERQTSYPLLYSLSGVRYCDLLLASSERLAWKTILGLEVENLEPEVLTAASERAAQILRVSEQSNLSLISIALDYFISGCAALYATLLKGESLAQCHVFIRRAMDDLRHSGVTSHLPLGLLAYAWLHCLENNFDGAQADLDEAWEIAERGPMPLYMADIHLYRARLFFREAHYPWQSPQADLAEARRLIEQHGYWRRKEELEDAERVIGK